ncbi:sulfatase [Halocalculus aciditolerans]|uniref:sulfatase n=1 Tax=Halocalculus aciditolerans TaxID=1383812 RepID=UPI0016696656|nr:sulfatase [Halocalculus aciditolerans]
MTRRPNVVWVTLDSVRLDHTSLGGYERDTTPNLARIANDGGGQATSNAISHATWTLPSTASILSGTYPSHHEVGFGSERLPESLRTVPELLREEGYHTIGVSRNSHLSDATDLSRGFEEFDWLASSTLLQAAGLKTTLKYLFNLRTHSAGYDLDTAKHSTPFLMNRLAKRRLDDAADGDEPLFCYLHYNEPHRPYYPPLPYLDRYTDELEMSTEEAAEFSMDVHYNLYEYVAEGCPFSEDEWGALVAMYDAEIRYTDEMIGRLFDYVQSLDLDDTVFVVTADHGELFGEHGMLAHKAVPHDGLVNVPLVVHGADFSFDSADLVQHADVMQTLVAGAGGDTDQFQGVDLREETRERAIVQRDPLETEPYLQYNPDFDVSRYHEPMLTAVRDTEWKFLYSDDGEDLYRLPDESTDVAADYPEVTAEFEAFTEEWLDGPGAPLGERSEAEFTDAMKQQLADLGYVE